MALSDPIADMLTRIRNAARNRAREVIALNSTVNRGIADVLVREGFISSFDVLDNGHQGLIKMRLRYGERGETILNQIDRVSRPGCRVYNKVDDLPRPMQGLGIAIVSTSHGVLSDRMCREKRVGGEVLCTVA